MFREKERVWVNDRRLRREDEQTSNRDRSGTKLNVSNTFKLILTIGKVTESDDCDTHTQSLTMKLEASMIVCQDKSGLIQTWAQPEQLSRSKWQITEQFEVPTHIYKHHLPPSSLHSRLADTRVKLPVTAH